LLIYILAAGFFASIVFLRRVLNRLEAIWHHQGLLV